jgi:hypothetical protein
MAIVVAALAAACGGGGTPTKAEYAAKLDAMCEDFAAREREIGEPRTPEGLAERGGRVADAFDLAIRDKVRELDAPDEIAAQAARMRALAEQLANNLRALSEAARGSDASRVRALGARNAALNSEATEIARELGADSCAAG